MKTVIRIKGMKCQHCAASTRKALEELGLVSVEIDVAKGEASYEGAADGNAIRRAIAAKGFEVVDQAA